MGDAHQERRMSVLPWTLLSRRTAFHSELQASPCEVLYGNNVRVPGDLPSGADIDPDHRLPNLLDRVQENAQRAPAQTSIRRNPAVYYPPTTTTATHVYVRKAKHGPLEPIADGPFRVLDRIGKSAITIKVGQYKNGVMRTETHHWKNCHPIILPEDTIDAERPVLGRKPMNIS